MDNKEKAVALLKSIETGNREALGYINPDKYIQHNLNVADGPDGFSQLLKIVPPTPAKINIIRVFQDNDYVFTHSEFNFFGANVAIDIFRFEEGKIVEHWDNLQENPKTINPGGHTMSDGSIELTDIEKTDENKTIVLNALNILISGIGSEKLGDYFGGESYINHNPKASDGLSGFAKGMAERAKMGIVTKYEKIHKILGEGNFVLAVTEGSISGKPTAFYDIFRVQDGKIAEHWDVVETILDKQDWKNENGKFNFRN